MQDGQHHGFRRSPDAKSGPGGLCNREWAGKIDYESNGAVRPVALEKEKNMSADPIIKEANEKMDKTLATFHDELKGVRSGRATPDLLNNIRVEYYGSMTPLQQLASTAIMDARTLVVTPYDATIVKDIEKAIQKSELGVTPHVDNKIVRVSIPALTEERRKDLTKFVKTRSEGAKTAMRNVRRDANKNIDTICKDKKISEDQRDKAKTAIQKTIESHEKKIDTEVAAKVAEIMQV